MSNTVIHLIQVIDHRSQEGTLIAVVRHLDITDYQRPPVTIADTPV